MLCRNKVVIDSVEKLHHDLGKAKLIRDEILNVWNNYDDLLLHHCDECLLWKNSCNKEGCSACRKLSRLNAKISKIQQESSTNHNVTNFESSNSDFSIHSKMTQKCSNCNRRPFNRCPERNEIQFQTVRSDEIKAQRAFIFVRHTRSADPIECQMCTQCASCLILEDIPEATMFKCSWPEFFWNFFQSLHVRQKHSAEFVWKLIPFQWRKWWFNELQIQFPVRFGSVSLSEPAPMFVDRTEYFYEFNAGVKSQNLPKIVDACNRFLMPTILCPWGCSEFLHMSGKIDLDTMIRRFIERSCFCDPGMEKFNKVEYFRDDFIRPKQEDHGMWLCNPTWRVLPTLVFKDCTPVVLPCKDHNKGTN